MEDLTLLNIGSTFGKMRTSRWNSYLIKEMLDVEMDFRQIRWHDAIKDDYKFPKTSNRTVVRFYSPYPDREMNELIEEEYGQTHLTPGERYTEGFCSMIDTIDQKIKEKIDDPVYVNSPDVLKILRDKRKMSKIFMENNIPHPKTFENPDVEAVFNEIENGKTLIFKPIGGSCGRGITRLRKVDKGYEVTTTWKSSEEFIAERKSHTEVLTEDKFKKFISNYLEFGALVQEWIEPFKGEWEGQKWIFDMRELVLYPNVYETPITEMIRRAPPDEITTNISMHNLPAGYLFARNNLGEEGIERSRKLAMKAVKVFDNLNVAGVDILWKKWGERIIPVTLENNGAPGTYVSTYSGVPWQFLEMVGLLKSLDFDIKVEPKNLCYQYTVENLYNKHS